MNSIGQNRINIFRGVQSSAKVLSGTWRSLEGTIFENMAQKVEFEWFSFLNLQNKKLENSVRAVLVGQAGTIAIHQLFFFMWPNGVTVNLSILEVHLV